MHALSVLERLNAEAETKAAAIETNHNRHCSYCESRNGIVLHSAKLRSTVFLSDPNACRQFKTQWFGTNSAEARDKLVESYFG